MLVGFETSLASMRRHVAPKRPGFRSMSKKPAARQQNTSESSKAERVYQTLRSRIRSLEYPPGSQLKKVELAEELEVSRAPLSDAITRLAQEGLVDVFPQSGSFVSPIRPKVVREAMLIRTGLEVEAMRVVAGNADDTMIAALHSNVGAQRDALEGRDMEALDDLDAQFHQIIMDRVDAPRIAAWLDICRAQLDRPRYHALPADDRPSETVREHEHIVSAIATRDPEFAGAAMRIHLRRVSDAIELTLERMQSIDDS